MRKRKPQKEDRLAGRDKLASRIITFSLLLTAIVLIAVAIKMTVGAPPTKERDLVDYIDYQFLEARFEYMMHNPTNFLAVDLGYDPSGLSGILHGLPEGVDTKEKIIVRIYDNRSFFSNKSGMALLEAFKRELERIYSFIERWQVLVPNMDMDIDIVAIFFSSEDFPFVSLLGYFYQGEYHLWEE